jgi:hypothetical protein
MIVCRYQSLNIWNRMTISTFDNDILYVIRYEVVYCVSYLTSCMCAGAIFCYNKESRTTRTSTTTWRDNFLLGIRSSSHQAQQLSVRETLSWVQWCNEDVDGAAPPDVE